MKRRRPPAEKKRLSYERDCVNVYAENDKTGRAAIRKFKAASNRAMRTAGRTAVAAIGAGADEQGAAKLNDLTFRGLHPFKRKVADIPLGLALIRQGRGKPEMIGAFQGRNVPASVERRVRRYDLEAADRASAEKHDE